MDKFEFDPNCEACEFDMCFDHDPDWTAREELGLLTTPNDPVS